MAACYQAAAGQAETCPVFEWFITVAGCVEEPVLFFEKHVRKRVGEDWLGVATRDEVLVCEFRCRVVRMVVKERFPSNKTRHRIGGRAQEFILTTAWHAGRMLAWVCWKLCLSC